MKLHRKLSYRIENFKDLTFVLKKMIKNKTIVLSL